MQCIRVKQEQVHIVFTPKGKTCENILPLTPSVFVKQGNVFTGVTLIFSAYIMQRNLNVHKITERMRLVYIVNFFMLVHISKCNIFKLCMVYASPQKLA